MLGGNDERYAYCECRQISQTDDSTRNPDSLRLLVQSLVMDQFLWDSGRAETMQKKWDALKGSEAGRAVLSSFSLDLGTFDENWAMESLSNWLENQP